MERLPQRQSLVGKREATRLLITGLIGIAAAVPARAQAPPPSADETAVTSAVVAVFTAVERGDLAALDTLYAGDSLTVIEGSGINRGWTDYRDHHLAPELREMRDVHYRPTEIEAHVAGNVAWAIFRYVLRARDGERPIDNVGRGTAILERRLGRWVVRHTQTASRARRATDPADAASPSEARPNN